MAHLEHGHDRAIGAVLDTAFQHRLDDLTAENERLRQAADLHRDLIDLARGERGLAAMVDRLSTAVGNPVALADQLFHLLASAPSGVHGDRHRRESVAHGGTPRRVLDDPNVGAHFRLVAEQRCPTLFPGLSRAWNGSTPDDGAGPR